MKRIALFAVVLSGCSRDASPPPAPAPKAAEAPKPSDPNLIRFEAPAAWVKETPRSGMRKAQYRVPDKEKSAADAELALFNFRGGGTFEDNVRRWGDQMRGGAPKTELLEGKCKVGFVDISGEYVGDAGGDPVPDARMLAAIVETSEGPWIFKLVGPSATVSDWRDEFVTLLKGAYK